MELFSTGERASVQRRQVPGSAGHLHRTIRRDEDDGIRNVIRLMDDNNADDNNDNENE